MDHSDKNVKKLSVRFVRITVILIVFIALVLLALSTYYYRSLELRPSAVWHGANMGVRSLWSGPKKSSAVIDPELMSRVSEKLERGKFAYSVQSNSDISGFSKTDFEIKNQIAANQARDARLKKDLDRLEQVNQQLLNSKSTLDALNQDYSNMMPYHEAQAARRAEIQAALESDIQVPSDNDTQALIPNRDRSGRSVQRIPQAVLDNVQKTTGISPEEINKLMNQ